MENQVQNLALFTRRSVKVRDKDEKISEIEIATPSIREGALPGAAVPETVNNEETSKVIMVAIPSIREGAVPAAKNEETSQSIMVLTPSIREGAVPAANNEETTKVTVEKTRQYRVDTPSIREGAVPAAKNEKTSRSTMVLTPPIREGAVPAANNEETTTSKVEISKLCENTSYYQKETCLTKQRDQKLIKHHEAAMLDSADVLKERTHFENSPINYGIDLINLKVNLILLFTAFLWVILFNKCIILNTIFLVHKVMILASVYCALMGIYFCVNS